MVDGRKLILKKDAGTAELRQTVERQVVFRKRQDRMQRAVFGSVSRPNEPNELGETGPGDPLFTARTERTNTNTESKNKNKPH